MKIYCTLIICLLAVQCLAQDVCYDVDMSRYPTQLNSNTKDGAYYNFNTATSRGMNYPNLDERDAAWTKRIWRVIELKEKFNHPLYYPVEAQRNYWSLWDVIRYNIEVEANLTPYDPGIEMDDQFKYPIQRTSATDSSYCKKIKSLLYDVSMTPLFDEDGDPLLDEDGDEIMGEDPIAIEASDIVRYLVKEDWYFDKQHSEMKSRIIGIAPVIYSKDANGDIRGFRTLFWLYFPECRSVFQGYEVFGRKNDSQRMSFDDLFHKRMFSSYIYKESNPYNRSIPSYTNGLDALLESDRIKRELANTEHDLWNY